MTNLLTFDMGSFQRKINGAGNAGSPYRGMGGPDRAMACRLATGTGFRADELRSLLRANFCLHSEPPTVTVEAASAKSGEEVDQPIRQDLAEISRPWLVTRPSDGPVLPLPDREGRLLRADLKAAGIPYVDASSRIADFHALRVTYITAIVKGGATVKQAKSLSRHSDPKLTLNVYAKLGINDLASALDALPGVKPLCPNVATMKATSTDDTGAVRRPQPPTQRTTQ